MFSNFPFESFPNIPISILIIVFLFFFCICFAILSVYDYRIYEGWIPISSFTTPSSNTFAISNIKALLYVECMNNNSNKRVFCHSLRQQLWTRIKIFPLIPPLSISDSEHLYYQSLKSSFYITFINISVKVQIQNIQQKS